MFATDAVRRQRVAVLAVLLMFAVGSGVAGADQMESHDSDLPDAMVALRVMPSALEGGFNCVIPCEMAPFRPLNQSEADGIAALLPEGYYWDFSAGFGQLFSEDSPGIPNKVFVLSVDGALAPKIKTRIRSQVPKTFRSTGLADELDAMAIAIVGLQDTDLSAIFPVPFKKQPPRLSVSLGIKELVTSFPETVVVTTPYKIDGAGPALLREMFKKRIVLESAADALEEIDDSDLAASFVSDDEIAEIIGGAVEGALEESPRSAELLKPVLPLGKIPGSTEDAMAVDLTGITSAAGADGADAFRLQVGAHAGAQFDSTIALEGLAHPDEGGTHVDVKLSPLPAMSYQWFEAALVRQLLRGWRWNELLERPDEGAAQALVRMTEPLWDWLVDRAVRGVMVSQVDGDFDPIDTGILDDKIARDKAIASSLEAARKYVEVHGTRGQVGDGYFPVEDDIDHEISLLIYRGIAGPSFLAGKTAKFADQLARVIANGATRPAAALEVKESVNEILGTTTSTIPAITRKADLSWFATAVSTGGVEPTSVSQILEHPLAELDNTRVQKALKDLVVTKGVQSVSWSEPLTFPEAWQVIVLDDEALRLVESAVRSPVLSSAKFDLTSRVADAFKQEKDRLAGTADPVPSESWFTNFETAENAASRPITPADRKAFYRLHHELKVKLAFEELEAVRKTKATAPWVEVVAYEKVGTGLGYRLQSAGLLATSDLSRQIQKAFETAADMVVKMAQLRNASGEKARQRFYDVTVSKILIPYSQLPARAWSDFLIGDGITKPYPAQTAYARLESMLLYVAEIRGIRLKLNGVVKLRS